VDWSFGPFLISGSHTTFQRSDLQYPDRRFLIMVKLPGRPFSAKDLMVFGPARDIAESDADYFGPVKSSTRMPAHLEDSSNLQRSDGTGQISSDLMGVVKSSAILWDWSDLQRSDGTANGQISCYPMGVVRSPAIQWDMSNLWRSDVTGQISSDQVGPVKMWSTTQAVRVILPPTRIRWSNCSDIQPANSGPQYWSNT
jgi:hypothetical protein